MWLGCAYIPLPFYTVCNRTPLCFTPLKKMTGMGSTFEMFPLWMSPGYQTCCHICINYVSPWLMPRYLGNFRLDLARKDEIPTAHVPLDWSKILVDRTILADFGYFKEKWLIVLRNRRGLPLLQWQRYSSRHTFLEDRVLY